MRKFKNIVSLACSLILLITMNITPLSAQSVSSSTPTQQYQITIGNKTIVLNEGEKVVIPLVPTESNPSTRANNQTVFGESGTLTIWGSGKYFNWDINMSIPATEFIGYVSATDLASGLSSGMTRVTGFSGSCICASISGHLYGATIDGTAYLLGVKVASTVYNYITWVA